MTRPGWLVVFSGLVPQYSTRVGAMARNLFEIIFKMKNMGVGNKFTRTCYNKYPGAPR